MGAVYVMEDSKFLIKEHQINDAFASVVAMGNGYYEELSKIARNYSGYNFEPNPLKLQVLVSRGWGFKLNYQNNLNGNGDITSINWIWENCCEDNVLRVLAPYVETGSYIIMRTDGAYWRWMFRSGKLIKQVPKITWLDEDAAAHDAALEAHREGRYITLDDLRRQLEKI